MGEYSTGRGQPARHEDGSSKFLHPNEVARIERQKMMRDIPSFSEPRMEEFMEQANDGHWYKVSRPWAPDVEVLAELDEKTNGYFRETKSDEVG
jgi:hypothetical protein